MMNLRALRYFVAIADAGSLSAAAESISIAQPALSRQLRELESDLGVQLLQRSSRGVRLTRSGVTLYEAAQRMLAEAARVRLQLTTEQETIEATVTVGVSPTLAPILVPGLVESFQLAQTGVRLSAREAFTPALLEWLEKGLIDLAIITNTAARRSLNLQPLLAEPLALVSHATLKIGPTLTIRQLANIPLVMTTLHRGLVEHQLLPIGGKLNVQAQIDSVASIRELVLHGRWATIMPVSVFRQPRFPDQLVMSEILGVQLHRTLLVATRIEQYANPASAVLLEMIQREFSRLVRLGMFSLSTPAPDR